MSDKELSELIHKSVYESLLNNKEAFKETFLSLTSNLPLQTKEQSSKLQEALFDYTTSISELTCVAVFNTLSSMGILDTSSEDV